MTKSGLDLDSEIEALLQKNDRVDSRPLLTRILKLAKPRLGQSAGKLVAEDIF